MVYGLFVGFGKGTLLVIHVPIFAADLTCRPARPTQESRRAFLSRSDNHPRLYDNLRQYEGVHPVFPVQKESISLIDRFLGIGIGRDGVGWGHVILSGNSILRYGGQVWRVLFFGLTFFLFLFLLHFLSLPPGLTGRYNRF